MRQLQESMKLMQQDAVRQAKFAKQQAAIMAQQAAIMAQQAELITRLQQQNGVSASPQAPPPPGVRHPGKHPMSRKVRTFR